MDFLENLAPLLKSFWYVAIPTSIFFVLQTILTFIGADASDGTEADFNGDFDAGDAPFQLFSLRNLINFLLGFSWTGISFYDTINNKIILVVLAFLVGIFFVYIFFLVIKQIQKLTEDNSFKFANTLHKTADVYLTIPERKSGKGKVIISINGAYHELDAITENDKIQSGSLVKVVRIENDKILVVETI